MFPEGIDPRVRRWFRIWIATGILILLIVVGLLIGTFQGVEGIPDHLGPAGAEVTGIGNDVQRLPERIEDVNTALAKVADAVGPLHPLVRRTIGNLRTIRGSLASVETRLNRTTGLLTSTHGVLRDTAGTLDTVSGDLRRTRGLATQIAAQLRAVQSPGSQGTALIARQVGAINAQLAPAESTASSIVGGLKMIDGHLEAACQALPVGAVLPGAGGTGQPPETGGDAQQPC